MSVRAQKEGTRSRWDGRRGEAGGEAGGTGEYGSRDACRACAGKHEAHTCGKGRAAKKRRKQRKRGKQDGVQSVASDDSSDAASDTASDAKRARPTRRTLQPIPQIGLGHCYGSSALHDADIARCLPGAALPTPWCMRRQPESEPAGKVAGGEHASGATPEHGARGPFGDGACLEWMRDPSAQQHFAQQFSAPLLEDDVPMRRIPSDHPSSCARWVAKDYTSKALFAVTQTHRSTWLDIPRTAMVSDVCVPQFHCDRRSTQLLDGGPSGGAAVAECWMWKMSTDCDVLVADGDILKLVDYTAQGIRGDPEVAPLWPAIATAWTEPLKASGRQPVLRGGRYVDETNLAALQQRLPFSTSRDIDPHLLSRIVPWRASGDHGFDIEEFEDGESILCVPGLPWGLDNKRIVPPERAVNDPAAESKSAHALDEQPHQVEVDRLFDLFLYVDVFHGTDAEGNRRQIKLDGIYLRAKMPGVEPLLALKQMAKAMPGMVGPLESTL